MKLFQYEDRKGRTFQRYCGSEDCIEDFFANANEEDSTDEAPTENYPIKLVWGARHDGDDDQEHFTGRLKDGYTDDRYILGKSFRFVHWNDIARKHGADFIYEHSVRYFFDHLKAFTEYALSLRYAPVGKLSTMYPEQYVEGEEYLRNKYYHVKHLAAEEARLTAVFENHLNEDAIRLVAEYSLPRNNRIRIDYTCWNDNCDERWEYKGENDTDATICDLVPM